MKLTTTQIAEIAKFTEYGAHTNARIFICSLIGLEELHRKYIDIKVECDRMNCTPSHLYAKRYDLDQELKAILIEKLDSETFSKVWGSL